MSTRSRVLNLARLAFTRRILQGSTAGGRRWHVLLLH
jgi:hypothetical protein